ncbi:MAG: DEAD/DEAH box helicase family protein [Nitrososphaeria archaeon]
MNFKELSLKRAFSSDYDDILNDFYVPVLERAVEYNRLAGFFSSKSLAVAARGILGLIKNDGIMRLIVSPKFSKEDVNSIIDAYENPEKYVANNMLKEIQNLENDFVRDHVFALAWMLANKRLEIKVAILYDEKGKLLNEDEIQQLGIFHQKVGILKDSENNIITFSGSVNETAEAWLGNIEEFKVFRSWDFSEKEYVEADIKKFERFWNNLATNVKTINLPDAVKEKLISIAPDDVDKIDLRKWYRREKRPIMLYPYQLDAVQSWLNNNMKGIFEMATGTGKTFTALACLKKAFEVYPKLLCVITVPYQHLIQQWKNNIEKFELEVDGIIIADSNNAKWNKELFDSLADIYMGYKKKMVILTTHNTFSSKKFIDIIKENKRGTKLFLIADEVHNVGAEKRREGLIEEYELRLALSATPNRLFDEEGTNIIYEYFNCPNKKVTYEFSLRDAINKINPATGKTFLTPYEYLPHFIQLEQDELECYFEASIKIVKNYFAAKEDSDKEKYFEQLLFARANIVKNAIRKYDVLEKIVNELKNPTHTIVYCTPQQIDNVVKLLNKKGIYIHRFTMEEGTVPSKKYNGLSQREYILNMFQQEKIQVLVAMKCLDQGVDIPQAKTAILMASSGNPIEYIQRIGRIIRRYPGKEKARIYDIIVVPSFSQLSSEFKKIEYKIFNKEVERYEFIASNAINSFEALNLIRTIREKIVSSI